MLNEFSEFSVESAADDSDGIDVEFRCEYNLEFFLSSHPIRHD